MKGSNKGQIKKEAANLSDDNLQAFSGSIKELADRMIKQGMTPKDSMGLTNRFLESVYAQAYRLYNTGKYIEATHLFRFLILMDSTESKYVLGLAACFHMLKEYKNAIQTYTMCAILDPRNPIPHYHASDCYIQMKDFMSAMLCLDLAIKYAGEKPEYSKMKERALLSLESLKKQEQSEPQTTA